ncbi:ShlB/FhaC/HecB family hemolysin secretion/activation protein [Pseudomonas guariconensis]|uniref:ShlB/FhaC/HecB family hemolysin secretion/activation protein n=1 Tax=Pseudomonas guariconensis TaxID=1288410 RepID=UPI0018AC66A5|nr:ShlB/FhaC/HecB family hemolysin secretion/activation protein [Pseudomonas guariconensis]MBF8754747.1 ShlB/FhaC/HecB family hemolysin secretion/activation protein [Pseudomonas guariconensis]
MPTSLRRIARHMLASLALALIAHPPVWANDPATSQLREQQRALQLQERRQRLERWQRRRQPGPAPDDPTPAPSDSRCWPTPGLRLSGNHVVPNQDLEAALRPLWRPCQSVDDVNRLLRSITDTYVQAGYPASRPYLARQPQAGVPLDIVIAEGFVESIELADASLPLSLRGAFPDLLGQPLYLPALEQGLDQLNRLRAYDLNADLLPGELQSGTRVIIQPRRTGSRWHLDSRLDNRGSDLTGRHRLNLGLGLDSPLGLNDDLRLGLASTVFDAPGQSKGVNLYYSVPYGPWSLALNASWMRYRAPLPQRRQVSSGESNLQGLNAERLLWRNNQGMLSALARLDRKQLVNRIQGTPIAQQSPTLTTLEAGLNLLWLEGGLWNAYVGVSQNLDWFGAEHPLQTHERGAQTHWRKYRASFVHLRQGPVQWPWRWQSELNLQYSEQPLPAIEQLLLSDDAAVRGWRRDTVAGASGVIWRNTFSQPLPFSRALEIRPHLGLDLGWTRFAPASAPQRIAGGALGVEIGPATHRLRLDYQRALYASERNRRALGPGIWVLEWTLSL